MMLMTKMVMLILMLAMLGNHENEGGDGDVDGDVVEDDVE